jgi:hypothetical protein
VERPDQHRGQARTQEDQRNSPARGIGSNPKDGRRYDRAGTCQFAHQIQKEEGKEEKEKKEKEKRQEDKSPRLEVNQ